MDITLLQGDSKEVLETLPDKSVHCMVTSIPYYALRDYGTAVWVGGNPECDHKPSTTPGKRGKSTSTLSGGKSTTGHEQEGYLNTCPRCGAVRVDKQIGLESSLQEYIEKIVDVFAECRRVLRNDGTLWVNIGDTYAGGGEGVLAGLYLIELMNILPACLMLKVGSNVKISWEYLGGLPLRYKMTAGIYDVTLSGISRIPCRKARKIDHPKAMNTFSCFQNP